MCKLLLLLFTFFIGNSIAHNVEFCYVHEDDPYLYMGTKTAYTFSVGSGSQFSPILNCEPMQFWMVAKHEARYPSSEKIAALLQLSKLRDQIITNHEIERSGYMCNEDLDNLRSWWPDPDMTNANAKKATARSANDVGLFISRLQSYFPELLQPNFREMASANYIFRTSGSKATETEAKIFKGIFHSRYSLEDASTVIGEDTFVKTYSNCSRISQNDEFYIQNAFEEHDKFVNSTYFMSVTQNVSRRIGFKYTLSAAPILLMYDMCRYEKAWAPDKLSPWCAVFSKDDLKILEYAEDIKYYYGGGYGRQKKKNSLGCFALQDMFKYFRALENQPINITAPKGIFYFTDSMFILNTLTVLGIQKDSQPLLSSNYQEMARRQWRTSFLAPFSSNLIAVFHRCQDTESPNKVMFYFQEKPLMLEGCQVGLCDWEYLKNRFQRVLDECYLERCHAKSESSLNYNNIISIITTASSILTWRMKYT